MLDFLFYLCIEPLETAMRAVLFTAHSLTGSWGASLVLLSLVVNIALIPVYHLAETWQEAERAIQRKMAPKLAEINAVFAGREKYMYTRALYRLHEYSPIYALRTSFGLLIQIPFFFAAYHLLNAAPELAGASWLFLRDLSLPDALLSFDDFSVNVMPFVMTGVNLLSAAVYTARLTKREKIQLYGLAALFLVLLYPSSAALLVYWTCNNLFSFGKNIVYTRFVYSRMEHPVAKEGAKEAAPVDAPEAETPLPGKRPPAWADCIPALCGAGLLAAAIVLRKRMGVSPALLGLLALGIVLAATALLLRLRALKRGVDAKRALSRFFAAWPLLVAFVTALCVWKLTSFKKIATPDSWAFFRLYAVLIGLLAGWAFSQKPLQPLLCSVADFAGKKLPPKAAGALFGAAVLILGVLVCWYTPATLYATDPNFFYEPFVVLFAKLTFRLLVFYLVARLVFHWTSALLRPFMALVFTWAALAALLFTFAATGDYGTMDEFILQNPRLLKTRLAFLVDIAVTSVAAVALWFIIRKGKAAILTNALHGLSFALCLMGAYLSITAPANPYAAVEVVSARPPDYNDELFGFSKTGENTLVIMLDMFTGGHMEPILEQAPSLRQDLDGFVWYPDTMSPGATTLLSIGALLGGEYYTPPKINARRAGSLTEVLHEAFSTLPGLFVPRNYSVALADVDELLQPVFDKICPVAAQTLVVGKGITTSYTGYWREKRGLPSPLRETRALFLGSFGLFRAAPWVLRNHIYFDGSWLNTQTVIHNPSEGPYAMLDSLPDVANADATRNTLKYITSQVAHYPWRLDEATCMPVNRTGEYHVGPDRVIAEHVNNERCGLLALARWFKWMQENNVYDNTQIILVSDHDGNDSASFGKAFDDLRPEDTPWKPHALLLVKQRGSRGELRVDPRPMDSADVLPLICAASGPCPGIDYPDPLADTGEKRVRTHSAGLASIRRHARDHFITEDFSVTGSMFERDNWKVMEKEQ